MSHSHTFTYQDADDFIVQLDAMLTKLLSGAASQRPYDEVRSRYPHLTPASFTMRLKRFNGKFPCSFGHKGHITQLFVTRELDEYLRK